MNTSPDVGQKRYAEVFAREDKNIHSDYAVREKVYQMLTPLVKDKVVADIGCGDGYPASRIMALGAKSIIGIDINKEMIKKAQSLHNQPGVHFAVGDALDLPIPGESVDVAVSILTYPHLFKDQMDKANAEIRRILRPGGVFILVIPHPQNFFMKRPNIGWFDFHYDNPVYADDQVVPFTLYNRKKQGVRINAIYHRLETYEESLRKNGLNITFGIDPAPDKETLETYAQMGGERNESRTYRIYKARKDI